MREDTVVQLRQPGTFSDDALTEILRLGARRLLARAVEMEAATFVEMHADLTDEAARRRAFVTYYDHHRYHESLNNLTPADVYLGRGQTILLERERIKRRTIEHRKSAA